MAINDDGSIDLDPATLAAEAERLLRETPSSDAPITDLIRVQVMALVSIAQSLAVLASKS